MTIWNDDPSYTHGYLVIPIALFILWQQTLEPRAEDGCRKWFWHHGGVGFFWPWFCLLRAVAYERGSEWFGECNHHSCCCGFDMVVRQLAAVAPRLAGYCLSRIHASLPQRINNVLALPLQSLAASSSHFLLQLTGMWVIQEGNVINLSTAHGMERLDVALACNGLRMLMTMAATVMATVILLPLPNWKRIVLILSIVPIALVSNMARIVATGWSYYLFEGETAKHWAHDWAGWLMMPLALALVGLELGILSWLVPKESEDDKPVSLLLNVQQSREDAR